MKKILNIIFEAIAVLAMFAALYLFLLIGYSLDIPM